MQMHISLRDRRRTPHLVTALGTQIALVALPYQVYTQTGSAFLTGLLGAVELAEAPTERLLNKALTSLDDDAIAIVDTPPGDERLLQKALDLADVVVVPTRVGGVETARVEAVLPMIPRRTPRGLVISSARTYTRDHAETVDWWAERGLQIFGSIPERVSIASGPEQELSEDGIEAYRAVWRRVQRAAR